MEVNNEENLCRLCYTSVVEYINLFGNSVLNSNVVDTLKRYFNDEVNESDIFPKVICIECWDKVEEFHKFYETVIAQREFYLRQHLNNVVKEETTEGYMIPDFQSEVHKEMVCGDPLVPIKMAFEEENETLELEELKLQYESVDEREHSNDSDANEELFNSNELPENTNHGRNIRGESHKHQQQAIVQKYSSRGQKTYQASKTFICDICQKSFFFYHSVERHILNVHSNKWKYSCDQCDQSFKSQKHLRNHLEVSHLNSLEEYMNEVKCMKFNTSEAQIKSICKKYFDQKCELCGAQIDSFEMAKVHYLSEHENPDGYLRCCGNKIINKLEALDHIQWHIDPDIFRCRLCIKQYRSRISLIAHLRRHGALSTKQFACNICHQYYSGGQELKSHVENEHPGIQFPSVETNSNEIDIELPDYVDASCTKCSFTKFTSFKEMRSHCLEAHKSFGSVLCCKRKYFRICDLRDHIALHKNPDVYRCDVCEKSLGSRSELVRHKDWHSNKYQCHICQKSLQCKSYLIHHLKTHEKQEYQQRNFVCDICDKRYFNPKSLYVHRKTHFTQTVDYMCEFCAKKFKTTQQLKYHQKTKHSDAPKIPEKMMPTWQCDVCNKLYTNKYILATHKMKHESKPIKCSQCDKVSPNQKALEQHIKCVHNEYDFKCHLCHKSLKSQASLKDHIATHSNQKSYKCTYCDDSFIYRSNMYKHRKQMHEKEWLADKTKMEAEKMRALRTK